MTLFIVRGLPGSGKSTMAKKLTSLQFEADQFFMVGGKYNFDHTKLAQAHERCLAQVERALRYGQDVAVSNTFVKQWELLPYVDVAAIYNIPVTILTATGAYKNIHGVPENVVERMRENWEA